MPGMTDRDYFAAAALTGRFTDFAAFEIADAMLRERERTNHDAAPAARASVESVAPQPTTRGDSDRTDKAAPRPSQGTGDTPATHATRGEGNEQRECTEPVAWATFYPNGSAASVYFDRHPQHAEPLYRHPPCQDFSQKNLTLTDAEREAVSVAYGMMNERAAKLQERIATLEAARPFIQWARALQGLFERLGGVR